MHFLSPTLFFLAALPLAVYAQSNSTDTDTDTCNPEHNGLATGTLQYNSDCNATTWCNNGVCQNKGCRREEFPLGYPTSSGPLRNKKNITRPDKCPTGMFCPDEGSNCAPILPVGSACQLDRDDECEGPPNFMQLRDTTGHGLNVNGSICLNFVCQWSNVTVGQTCEVQNVGYVAYGSDHQEFVNIVSRDNCQVGLYCDTNSKTCIQQKDFGTSCDADKECLTFNCEPSQTCGKALAEPRHLATWVYVVIAVGIFGGMIGTLIILFFVHGRQRDVDREKRLQYWREQNAFRQNILQMRETARASVFGSPDGASRRGTLFGVATEDSAMPMLTNAAPKGSGLRYYVGEDGSASYENDTENELLVMQTPYEDKKSHHF
ncbi:hypothetical protein FA95DRAFT_354626 [Auriscalpium vulgare]|uniref:Uncharacterized protein n=1 Tax=Auriscalpium vulgare TaxID=40419 RepID=A0ACB8S438_9AGAM|nr:hypothetical protein FA95DRAFT_354626 [Auriscalpium vulgare]